MRLIYVEMELVLLCPLGCECLGGEVYLCALPGSFVKAIIDLGGDFLLYFLHYKFVEIGKMRIQIYFDCIRSVYNCKLNQ